MIREVAEDIWTVEGPLVKFAGAGTNTRMTVVRMNSGALWIHSPVAWTEEIEAFVGDQLVCALIAPNKFHHIWIGEWSERFPDAEVFAEEEVKKKIAALAGASDLGNEPPALYGEEIDQVVVAGNRLFQEVAFFHKASRTAIFTDLFINRPVDGEPLFAKLFLKFEDVVAPNGGIPRLYKLLTNDRAVARAAAARIKAWQPQHLLFSHSEDFSKDPMEIFQREFGYLD